MRLNHVTKYVMKQGLLALTISAVVASLGISVATTAAELPNGTPNNPVPAGQELCNLNVGFVIDRSNSIRNDSNANPGIITKAVSDVTASLQGTDSKVALWSFGTKATGYTGVNPLNKEDTITAADYPGIGLTSVKDAGGVNAVKNTVASIPYGTDREKNTPQQIHLVRTGYTNWQAALGEAIANGNRPSDSDILFVLSDGDPNFYTNAQGEGVWDATRKTGEPVVAGVNAANTIKAGSNKTRIVVLAVGDSTSDANYIANIKRITGGLNAAKEGQDYFRGNYNQLGVMMRAAIQQACDKKPVEEPKEEPEQKPTVLPNTGAGSFIALFSGVSGLAAGTHAFVNARRRNR